MRPRLIVAAVCLFVVAGCSDSNATTDTAPPPGSAAVPSSTVPPSVAPPSTSAADTTTTTGAVETTETVTTTTAGTATTVTDVTAATTTVSVEPVGRFLVDVPGTVGTQLPPAGADIDVAGEVYELIPKLYMFIPTEDSATDANIEPPRPEDQPILEAYARAIAADYALITQNPIPRADPSNLSWNPSWTVDWRDRHTPQIQARIDAGEHLEVVDGDLYRPFVLPELSSPGVAYLADCVVGFSDWVTNATGDTVVGEPAGMEIVGRLVEMHFEQGEWRVNSYGRDPRGCA